MSIEGVINQFSLEGKTIIVTGASSGIGRQCAITCSFAGANIVLIGRNEERLNDTLLHMLNPYHHMVVVLDLTDFQLVSEKVQMIFERKGCISGLLNCAGVSVTMPLKLASIEKINSIFQSNVASAYNLTKEVCKRKYFDKKGGSVIFMSSIMGVVGDVAKSLYSMTKGALISCSRSLACELAPMKIRVNTISPGVIITPINIHLPHISNIENRKKLEEKHPLGFGDTTDVANASIFLLSDASKWITGHNLVVDGGYTAK